MTDSASHMNSGMNPNSGDTNPYLAASTERLSANPINPVAHGKGRGRNRNINRKVAIPSSELGSAAGVTGAAGAPSAAPGVVGTTGGAPQGGKPKKKHSAARIISNILLVVGIALMAFAVYKYATQWWNYKQVDEENAKLAAFATVKDDGTTPPQVDWASLKAINADVAGWVQIPGTSINYPVYQGKDNERYLNTNAEGVTGVGGQIFLDYENTNPGMQDEQTIIYGHHLKNGAMFKQVADMDQQGFFDSIHTVWYVTEQATYELEPLFVYYTNENDLTVRQFMWNTPEEFHNYLQDKLSHAVTSRSDAANIIGTTSKVLTLSTCNYIEGYGRTILVCVQKGEAQPQAATGASSTDSQTQAATNAATNS